MKNQITLTNTINKFAVLYAENREDIHMTELVTLLMPKVESHALLNSRRYNVPKDDLVSAYLESIVEAAEEYKLIGDFEARWHVFKKKKASDVWKYHHAQKRNASDTVSMNVKSESGYEIGDSFQCIDSNFPRLIETEHIYSEFRTTYTKFGTIIHMKRIGSTNAEIAQFLGQTEYNELARKQVSLAKSAWRKFLKNE